MSNYSLEVVRNDLTQSRFTELPDAEDYDLAPGEAMIRVDRFGLTANNITYGVAGDMIGYWQFFPADNEWGRIPVWGTGTVTDAGTTDLKAGATFYGYFPMSSYLVVKPEHVTERGFTDGAAHRAELPPVYNQYQLTSPENGFAEGTLDHRMVFFPLFATGFVLDDYLDDNSFFDADSVILSSASSKTSFSLAFLLHSGRDKKVIGLTSTGNKAFVEKMGIYDQVVTYDDIDSLDASEKIAFVDMAGNGEVTANIHHHFGDNCVCSCGVGITHWESRDGENPAELPGARHEMFFAPTQIQKRNQDWGPELYQQKMNDAWSRFLDAVDDWVTLNHREGRDAMQATYLEVLQGAAPDQGFVVIV
jgi:hypothetical protein